MQTPVLTVTLNPALDLASSVEALVPGEKLRCEAPLIDPGGGGVNVSRVIARMGGNSRAAVALGGPTGQRIGLLLQVAGIGVRALPAPGETRESLAVTDRSTGRQYRFVLPGPGWTAEQATAALDAICDEAEPGAWVVLSGSNPPGVPDDFALRLARRLGARGQLLVDVSGAPLRAVAGAGAGIGLLRMNQPEAEDLAARPLPSRDDTTAFARDLVARGVALAVAVARGGDGNILATPEGVWHAEALPVRIISKVGAGDSFVGGLVLGRARGDDWPQALALAAACASAACMTPATELCRPEDVARLLAEGRVTQLA